jgi:hypothetical protein
VGVLVAYVRCLREDATQDEVDEARAWVRAQAAADGHDAPAVHTEHAGGRLWVIAEKPHQNTTAP